MKTVKQELNVSQNWKKNTFTVSFFLNIVAACNYILILYLYSKRVSGTGVFLTVNWNFLQQLFQRALLQEKKDCYKKRGSDDIYRKSNYATFYLTSPRCLYFITVEVVGDRWTCDKSSVKFKKFSKVKLFKPMKSFINLLFIITLQGFFLETNLIVLGSLKDLIVTFHVLNNNVFYSEVAYFYVLDDIDVFFLFLLQ